MADRHVQLQGFKELQAAIARSPQFVGEETGKLLTRAMSKYKKGIISNPWRVGGSGGGAPVLSHALRDSHFPHITRDMATIGPDPDGEAGKYMWRIHAGFNGADSKGRVYKQKARPWLDYVKEQNEARIQSLYREFLKNITRDLAK